jgi:hypothetical protein
MKKGDLSQLSDTSELKCSDCCIDLRFIGWVDCDDGKKRCLKCWEKWAKSQGLDCEYEHCEDCGSPLIEVIPVIAGFDYKVRCVFCHQKKFGVDAS